MSEKRDKQASEQESEGELRRRISQIERENRRLRERCEEADLRIVQLERELKNFENTLSFRLGHALIQSTKSVNGLRALPLVLSELRRDTRRRKKGASDEEGVLSAALRSSTGRVKLRLGRKRKQG